MTATRSAGVASPSDSVPSSKHLYDVFLSFRGADTRLGFTDNLYMTLKEAGIDAFLDDTKLRRGENIAEELMRAIEQSKISVVVFSRKYAESRWCLEELVKIMECRETLGQIVLPLFYDVDPSDVRKQTGCVAEAFDQKHNDKDKDQVNRWRAALTEAANLSGWDLSNAADGHEGLFIRKVRDEITRHLLNRTPLHVADHQVGVDSRMQDIIDLLGVGKDVRMVGIWGMGGIGKTMIAKAVYNHIFRSFEVSSFLAKVGETSKEKGGKVTLQNMFLSDILNQTNTVVGDIDKGIVFIKRKIGCRRVLVVVDDVNQLGQLDDLAIDPKSFGPGSRIIVTTRDKQLLEQLKVHEIYAARELNKEESLEFFSLHAFRTRYPQEEYVGLSRTVLDYCGGLPLAIEVLGSLLFRRSTSFWESTIRKLGKIPHLEIQEKLKLSFDGLNDETEKDIFLDISCFFIGMDMEYVKQILEGCGFFPESGIEVLLQRSLVTVNESNELGMHDLIRDMGRAIVRSVSPQYPGKRCRLWDDADAIDVLRDKSGTEAVEGFSLKMLTSDAKASFSTKGFSKMKRLRLLKLNYVQLTGGYKFFSNKLRWVCWHGFPLKSVPKDFSLQNLVAMDLQYSKLIHLWEDSRLFEKLKILNLSHSHYLSQLPDLSTVPNLENFVLEDCTSLSEVHHSIGQLDRLTSVNLRGCIMLKDLPRSFYNIKSMRTLVLTDCSRFEKLDDNLGNMGSLITLDACNTAIKEIPSSIVRLKNLIRFSLRGLNPEGPAIILPRSFSGLNCLTDLTLSGCSLGDDSVDLVSLYSLEKLNLAGNDFHSLPSLSGLSKLWHLYVNYCFSLHVIPDLPTSLTSLIADECPALERLPDLANLSLKKLYISDSPKLTEISGFDKILESKLNSLETLRMQGCTTMTTTLRDSLLQKWNHIGSSDGIFLPGSDIPEWFTVVYEGSTGFFLVPELTGKNVIAITLCVAYSPAYDISATSSTSLSFDGFYVTNHAKQTRFYYNSTASFYVTPGVDYIWLGHIPNNELNLETGDLFEVFVQVGSAFFSITPVQVKKIGIKMVWSDDQTHMRLFHVGQHWGCSVPYSPLPYVVSRSINEAGLDNETGLDNEVDPLLQAIGLAKRMWSHVTECCREIVLGQPSVHPS